MFNQKRLEQKKKGYSIRSDRVNAKQSLSMFAFQKKKEQERNSLYEVTNDR